jgi:hypothetical protein
MKKIHVFFNLILLFIIGFGFGNIFAQDQSENDLLAQFQKADKRKVSSWSGVWNYPSRYAPSTLTVKVLSATKIKFDINALNGANVGEISGTARVRGNKAFFDDRESNAEDTEKKGCRLLFINQGKSVTVKQSTECSFYGGNGVYFAGDYAKGNAKATKDNFVKREVFPNLGLDRKFKTLVDKDYEKFLDAFHIISEDEDLDALEAKVFSACVRGICPYMAGIIMFDAKGNIWAAVINDENEEKTLIHYYTNVAAWTDKLPKTIEAWIAGKYEMSESLTVIYKNKK